MWKKSFFKKSLFSFLVAALVCGYAADAFSFGSSTSLVKPPPLTELSCTPYEGDPWNSYTFSAVVSNSQEAIFDILCNDVTASISGAVEVLENQKQLIAEKQNEIVELLSQHSEVCEKTVNLVCDPTIIEIREVLDCPLVYKICDEHVTVPDSDSLKIPSINKMSFRP